MKKTIIVILLVISILVALLLILLNISAPAAEELILTTISPDSTYILEAYRTEPGATVDFSVKVYIIDGDKKKLIYNSYHEREADIIWITDDTVSINGKKLNLSQNDTYNWKDYAY